MIRLRPWSALALAVLLTPTLRAQEKPPAPWSIDRSLTVSPQGPPVPALRYRLFPLDSLLKEGNAIPIYLRLVHEQSDASKKYWTETPAAWNKLPIDRLPMDEVRQFLKRMSYFRRQLEIGARRKTAEWDYTLDEPDPIGMLLPDVQAMRNYVPMMVLQVRAALAENDFAAASHHLETGFAFCRHVAAGPTLIHKLVAIALANQFAGAVADFIERPGAPNLYWALATLPRPLVGLRAAQEWEYRMLELEFPELGKLDRERTPEQWDRLLHRLRIGFRGLSKGSPREGDLPKGCAPEDPAAKSPDLPAAREFVARTHGLTAEKVAAMPPAQVLILYIVGTYHEDRDDWYRAAYLPYRQARRVFEAAAKRLREAPITEGHVPARLLLPGLDRSMANQNRLERNLAALRVVEAVRLYAAAHDNKLPDKLSDVTEVPVPDDPGTGKPFEYTRDGDTATVVSQIPGDSIPNSGIRYRAMVLKK